MNTFFPLAIAKTKNLALTSLLAGVMALGPLWAKGQQAEPITQWFTDARFGMFIHFGLYSIPAGVWDGTISGRNMYAEWIQKQGNWPYGIPDKDYQALAKEFNPVDFDAEQWVLEAKNAGMKYMVITAKHHDGFALWPTKVSKFDVEDATPFKRDLLGELKAACEKHGLRLGFYYSHWQDWHHPGGARPPLHEFKSIPPPRQVTPEEFQAYWDDKCLPQVKELMESYQPALMWFDTWGDPKIITDDHIDELIGLVKGIDPDCLVNSRILQRREGIEDKVDFISMGDNSFPEETIDQPWETSGTFNHSWGYHQRDHHWEQSGSLLNKLVGNASRNGNFQLNIGPMASGEFPVPSIRRLREIGAWLFANGESIYGAKPNPFYDMDWGYVTWKQVSDDKVMVYLHVAEWPDSRQVQLYGFKFLPDRVYALETGQELDHFPQYGLVVNQPTTVVDERITVVAVEADAQLFEKYVLNR